MLGVLIATGVPFFARFSLLIKHENNMCGYQLVCVCVCVCVKACFSLILALNFPGIPLKIVKFYHAIDTDK